MFEDTSEVLFDQFTDAPGEPDDIGMVITAVLSEESRDRADLRHPALDRAGLQAGQGRAGLGRLPGPLRCRHPPLERSAGNTRMNLPARIGHRSDSPERARDSASSWVANVRK